MANFFAEEYFAATLMTIVLSSQWW